MSECRSVAEAIAPIQSHQTVFVHAGAATPGVLLQELVRQADRLRNVEIMHLHTLGPAEYASPDFSASFRTTNFFVGSNMRNKFNYSEVDYLPCFLSEIPQLFCSGKKRIDVALISLSPPDKHGFCSLGTSVDVARAAVDNARIVIAQINSQMPRVHGEGLVHLSRVDHWIKVDEPLPTNRPSLIAPEEQKIGELVAGMIEEGSTLQVGIGEIPDAVLDALKGHRHMGLHTEMWSDHALNLIECGAIDNSRKVVHPGVSVSSFVIGSKRVYDALSDNPSLILLPVDEVNNTSVIARNPKVVAVNSAVEVDLTGQVCSDSIGTRVISGVGGQMDFIRGAALSKGGKPIIAIKSRTKKGHPKIVATLRNGAGVVTTRAHVHYVVTEFGIADLYGRTLGERAKALISIAHPDDRENLERMWYELYRGTKNDRVGH